MIRGKGNLKCYDYQGAVRETEQTISKNLRLSKTLRKLGKWSPFPNFLYYLPLRSSVCLQGWQRERLVLLAVRSSVTAIEPQDLQTSVRHLGAAEGGHSPAPPFPTSRGSEWPRGISTGGCSCCFLRNSQYVWAGKSSKNELPGANSFCKLLPSR